MISGRSRTLSGDVKQNQRRIQWLTASEKSATRGFRQWRKIHCHARGFRRVLKMRQLLQEDSGVSRSRPEDSGVSLSRQENPGEDGIERHSEGFSEEREAKEKEGGFRFKGFVFKKNEKVRSETMPIFKKKCFKKNPKGIASLRLKNFLKKILVD